MEIMEDDVAVSFAENGGGQRIMLWSTYILRCSQSCSVKVVKIGTDNILFIIMAWAKEQNSL